MQNPPDMKVRLSAELRRQVEAAAKANNRTLNSEIVSRLERSFMEDAGELARSEMAAQKLLRMDLSGRPDPLQKQIDLLEKRVRDLEDRLPKS